MTVLAALTLRCGSPEAAASLQKVLAPDNVGFPRGQRFTASRRGSTLRFSVGGDAPGSVSTTVASLLRDAALFEEVWLLSRGMDARGRELPAK